MTEYEKLMVRQAREDLTEIVKRLKALNAEAVLIGISVQVTLKELEAIRAD